MASRGSDVFFSRMSTVNWVVAGIGDIARKRVLPAILAERRSALYGLVTQNKTKAEHYPDAKVWSTLEEALHDSAVDAVYIALPVAMHAEAAIAALRAGKYVLCEKPMAMNDAQAGKMVAEANASGCMLGVSYYRRLYPKLIRAKQLIAAGADACYASLPKIKHLLAHRGERLLRARLTPPTSEEL